MLEPAQTVLIFQSQPELKKYSAGETIVREGESGDCMYGLIEGTVEISVNGKVVETITPGEVFGTGALVGIHQRTYTAIAKQDSQLAYLDQHRFLFAIQETPLFALNVMKSYSERLSRLAHQVI